MEKLKEVIEEQIDIIKPEKEITDRISKISKEFIDDLKNKLKKKNILAEIFIGGSIAKNTLVKKDKYDVDIFVRFDKKYKNEISEILYKTLGKDAQRIHGSRDYFHLIKDGIILEIIPVIRIKKPEEATNVTDLSYFHVNYILNKTNKNKRLPIEIILAKAFAHSCDCYGAESYINGFSGYSLELLICHYGSFLEFIKKIAKSSDKDKIIIDDSKFFKNKEEILREVNEAKLQNPIILIDPTFKERNALASLSNITFNKFKKYSIEFLKNPSSEFFKRKNVFDEMKKYEKELITLIVKTNKQKGDIAGTKSKKFYNFFLSKLNKEFTVRKSEFDYDDKKNIAYYYLVLDKKEEEEIKGPPIKYTKGFAAFKKAHPNLYIKEGYSYIKIKHNLNFKDYFKKFLAKDKKIIKEMCIKEIKIKK